MEQDMIFSKEVSRISKAAVKSDSIRSTIPQRIADELGLNIGDLLEWKIAIEKNGDKYVKVSKSK